METSKYVCRMCLARLKFYKINMSSLWVFFLSTRLPQAVSLFIVVSCMGVIFGVVSCLYSFPPLSSERSVTPCLLRAPRSPFSFYPFLVFQCSLVPLCLLIRGEEHSQPTPTVCLPDKCHYSFLSAAYPTVPPQIRFLHIWNGPWVLNHTVILNLSEIHF